MNVLSGWYVFEGKIVELLPSFTYEVSLYKYWKNGCCFLGSKLYIADKLLHIKNTSITTKYEEYFIEKEITLVGVTEEFIKEHRLEPYSNLKLKKSKKK